MIPFTKAHACGNDFLIIKSEDVQDYDKADLTQRLCQRSTSIGADGIEFVQLTSSTAASARITLYNADGSIAEISGNGTRCVAAWLADQLNLQSGDQLDIETDAGHRTCTIDEFRQSDDGTPLTFITTDMAVPEFEERTVELADGTQIDGVYVSMGNPHFVIVFGNVASLEDAASPDFQGFYINDRTWQDVGEEICYHPDFPDQTNVEFVQVVASSLKPRQQVTLRIFERGVGPTESSGTGTSAAATAMIGVYGGVSPIEVIAPGGLQTVDWAGPNEPLYLTGPATLIARGEAW